MRRYCYLLRQLPDPGDPTLSARYSRGVRAETKQAAEQILRTLTTLNEVDIQAAIRLHYNPDVPDRQDRTTVELEFRADSSHEQAIRRLVESGPLSPLYDLEFISTRGNDVQVNQDEKPQGGNRAGQSGLGKSLDYEQYGSCMEIVRNEDGWRSEERRRELNSSIPLIYYLVSPFEADGEHDWLAFDRLLDRFESPAAAEVIVHPTDISEERTWHYRYVTQLMQVNRFGDDLDPEIVEMGERDRRTSQSNRVRDPMADDVLRDQERFHERLRRPHLHFAVRCWAETSDQARLLASTLAESSLKEGQYQVLSYDEDLHRVREASRTLSVLDEELLSPEVWDPIRDQEEAVGQRKLMRMCRLGTVDELKSLFRLPVAQKGSAPRTMRRHTDPPPTDGPSLLIGDDLETGDLPERPYPDNLGGVFDASTGEFPEVRIEREQFRKHLFVSGMSGSGKTIAVFNLLTQLARQDVPFLVVEPAKTEYRTLKLLRNHPDPSIRRMAKSLRVYTVGNEDISPFRFNPLAHPEGISRDEHIDSLFSCFRSVLPLHGPLEGLLAEAITRTYASHDGPQPFPRLSDLAEVVPTVVEEKSYSPETESEFSAALDVRLGMLTRRSVGRVFDCTRSVPDLDELFGSNVVLEMEYLTPEHASLVSLFLLTALREHARTARSGDASLQHVTILEEAHNIVGRASGGEDPEAVSPQASAAEYVTRMLAEMRALGEGIVIADQLPSSVSPKVVKNTGAKLAFRQVAEQDRETLGSTMLMEKTDLEELARLRPGESYVHFEDLHRPHRVRGLAAHRYLARGMDTDELPPPPSSGALQKMLAKESWFQDEKEARYAARLRDLQRLANRATHLCDEAEDALQDTRERLEDLSAPQATESGDTPNLVSLLSTQIEKLGAVLDKMVPLTKKVTAPRHRAELGPDLREMAWSLRENVGQEIAPRANVLIDRLREEGALLQKAASKEEFR